MNKIKCYKITPSPNQSFDSLIIEDTRNSWSDALHQANLSLDKQFVDGKDWKDIKVQIECIEMTQEEFDNLERD